MSTSDWATVLERRARRIDALNKPLSPIRRASLRAADARLTKRLLADSALSRAEVGSLLRSYHDRAPGVGQADRAGGPAVRVQWYRDHRRPYHIREHLIRVLGWAVSPIDGVWRDRR
ncbi:hypothetical protein ACIGKQ_22425 [Gordonia sp. NPDC062954]|uniref:hypothetical protein n=1 Tax=Gordonia sp. NPDC062954 TaxID=3364003 RepID=UPI0037C92F8B